MKIIIIILFTLTSYSLLSQGFNGKITYQVSSNSAINIERIKKDSTIKTDISRNAYLNLAKNAIPLNFLLVFNKEEANFKAEFDRITMRRMGQIQNYIGSMAKSHLVYYDARGIEKVLGHSIHFNDIIIAYDAVKWKFTQETKMIGTYICYKATAVINKQQDLARKNYIKPIVAWFCPEIPVHFGIRNFKGLPGLTMELTIETGRGVLYYKATKIELNTTEKIKIEKFKGKELTEDEYLEFMSQMNYQSR
ncbi:GLPGLI family protein [Flavicella sp.]|uniref:GLPGLI family protein n=1 Tax=Flavicella sp. TaxID=2957742 RepID=UPI0030175DF2